MADIPKLDNPIITEYDLGALDAGLAGKRLRVLRNPTIRFRAAFRAASYNPQGADWAAFVASIVGVDEDKLMDALGDFEQSVIQAMFTTGFDGIEDGKLLGEQPAHVFRVWDEYATEKRKAYGGRS